MTIPPTAEKLVVVGNADLVHVGAHLVTAAEALGYAVTPLNSEEAFTGSRFMRSLNWRLRGHRPRGLCTFSEQVVDVCRRERPRWMLATGIAPVENVALKEVGRLGTLRLNYLTDDPWNPSHAAPWFMDAMRQYDWIFSTRKSNLEDLWRYGCARVSYLPFAYAPNLHYAQKPSDVETARFDADVMFAGGGDPDRRLLMSALIRSGLKVALYGGYWNRYSETKAVARGHADPETLRKAVGGARVALCLVRRANRDGSAMRTFEIAAMGACVLAEHTQEHEDILGKDGEAVVYFKTPAQMIDRLRWLVRHCEERSRMGLAIRARITRVPNTYQNRLATMLAATAMPYAGPGPRA